tara:strand:+ start:216 stop:374 length:159 start_codon:yes stop_codon:yes gene_type:complete
MDNFTLFICGLVVTLIAGMGVITSEVFLGYKKFMEQGKNKKEDNDGTIKQAV